MAALVSFSRRLAIERHAIVAERETRGWILAEWFRIGWMEIFWEGLKRGMVIWPFPVKPGEWVGLPIYIVVPALVIVGGVVVFAVHLLSSPMRDRQRD